MKRYAIVFHSHTTGMGNQFDSSDTAADAVKKAQKANQQGLRDVRIIDMTTQEALDQQSFAARHRV